MTEASRQENGWISDWLDAVVSGSATMSQRSAASVAKHGGLDRLVEAARARGVHLVLLTDDAGKELVVAGLKPFRTLC